MKKVYSAPLTEVVKINAESMCVVSNYAVKSTSIDGSEDGFVKADKDDEDFTDDLW